MKSIRIVLLFAVALVGLASVANARSCVTRCAPVPRVIVVQCRPYVAPSAPLDLVPLGNWSAPCYRAQVCYQTPVCRPVVYRRR